MIYLFTKFCIPDSNGSLYVAIKPKAKYTRTFLPASILLPCILQQSTIIFEDLSPYIVPVYYIVSSAYLIAQILAFITLILLVVETKCTRFIVHFIGKISMPNFIKMGPVLLELRHADRHTHNQVHWHLVQRRRDDSL
jgi:hypothetical protein